MMASSRYLFLYLLNSPQQFLLYYLSLLVLDSSFVFIVIFFVTKMHEGVTVLSHSLLGRTASSTPGLLGQAIVQTSWICFGLR